MDMKMPVNTKKLGFGLMRLPMLNDKVDIEQTKQMVDLFMQKGGSYFDTAYGYINGTSETAIKEALVDRYPRESFLLATKLPAWAASNEADAKQMLGSLLTHPPTIWTIFYPYIQK